MLLSAGPVVDTGCQQEVKRPSARRNIYMRLSLIIAQLNSEDQVAKPCGPYRDIAARLFQQQPKKYKKENVTIFHFTYYYQHGFHPSLVSFEILHSHDDMEPEKNHSTNAWLRDDDCDHTHGQLLAANY